MGRVLLLVGCFLLASSMLISGCKEASKEESEEANTVEGEAGTDVSEPVAVVAPKDQMQTSDGIYKNSEGKIVCPVWLVEIESPESAEGSITLDGVTYYFSSEDAAKKFKQDPNEYIK